MPRTSDPIKTIWVPGPNGKKIRKYQVKTDAPRSPDGKRHQITRRFDRRGDAVKWLAAMRAGTAEAAQTRGKGLQAATFPDVVAPWLEVKLRTVRVSTYLDYETAVKIWSEEFGQTPMSEISKAQVDALVSRYQDNGRSARRVSYLLMVCRAVFEEAIEEGYATRNPAKRVKPRGKPAKDRRAMSAAEFAMIQATIANDPLEAVWLLSLAGLRRSEALALRWSHLDLDAKTVRIECGRVEIGRKGRELIGAEETTIVGDPKTSNGFRTLPVPVPVVEALRRLRTAQMQTLGLAQVRTGYLAVDSVGRKLRPDAYSDAWRALCKKAGIGDYTLHEARHSSVTLARQAGVPDMSVAQWHGHDETVMRRTYTHASDEALRGVGDALFGST